MSPKIVGLHYSWFGLFLSKKCMHLKTVQIEFFAIEIIISIHILCLKKVLPKCENWQKNSWFYLLKVSFQGHFCSLQSVPLYLVECVHKGDKRTCTFLKILKILIFHRDLIFRLYQWFTTTHSNNRKENDDIWALTKSSKSKFVFSKKQKVHHINHLLILWGRP